jgi:hypothetical protein
MDAAMASLVLYSIPRTEEMRAVAYTAAALAGISGERVLRASRVVAHPDRLISQRRARPLRECAHPYTCATS